MNKKLKILYSTNGVFIVGGALLGPLYAVFVEDLGATPLLISLSWATMLASALVTYYFISRFVNVKEHLNIDLVISGYLISGISWLLYLLVNSVLFLLFVQVVLGVGTAIGGPSWNALVAKHLDKGKSVHDYAEWMITTRIIEIVAVSAGGAIITVFSFETLFIAMASIAFISAIYLILARKTIES